MRNVEVEDQSAHHTEQRFPAENGRFRHPSVSDFRRLRHLVDLLVTVA
jgi:hypothetical protein